MRPEISNKLLYQVIQAWGPDEADKWGVLNGNLIWGVYYVRDLNTRMCTHAEDDLWDEASKLVEFLLKDRPDLGLFHETDGWNIDPSIVHKCQIATKGSWSIDPWGMDDCSPKGMVKRIKAYEYLKAWEESQSEGCTFTPIDTINSMVDEWEKAQNPPINWREPETYEGYCDWCKQDPNCLPLSRDLWAETCKTEVTVTVKRTSATYDQICPHCNGSKEVTGWLGKETCNAC